MKPRTQLERRVEKLASSLSSLTDAQTRWAIKHVFPHYAIHRTKSNQCVCVDCGHKWKGKQSRCPHCGAILTHKENSRQRVFKERKFYGIVRKCREFTVIRIFYIEDERRIGCKRKTHFSEVLQHWISEDGKDTIRALCIGMFPYYRICPYSLYSELSIKRDYDRYGYRNTYYHVNPDAFYPRMSHTPLLKRNGFRKEFHDFCAEDVFTHLLSDNNFETLWKLGRLELAEKYLGRDALRIVEHWKALLRTPPMTSDELTILLDYMDLLEYFGKDPNRYNYQDMEAVQREHDRLVRRQEEILERQRLEERKKKEKEKLAVLESKSKYFGITFGNDTMQVIVLSSIEEYQREGKLQHHCVYTNSYYGRKDSLVLSARMRDHPDKPVETIEISLKDGRILQCFGACNEFTEHHQEILDLVSKNSKRFLRA